MTYDTQTSSIPGHIIDSLNSGVLAVGPDRYILAANHTAREFLNVGSDQLRPGEQLDETPAASPLLDLFEEVKSTGAALSRREVALRLAEDIEKEIGLSASLLQGPEDFNGVIFLFTDLTQRRRLERVAELNRQLAALGELTAGIVHELRNPVSIISGMAELLMRKFPADDDRRAVAETILRETASLERSISQFLGFARPYDISRGWSEPETIAKRSITFCQRRAHRKATELECVCQPELPRIHVDGDRIAQAIANILVNAVDAVLQGEGVVALTCRQEGAHIVYEVLDNGPGIRLKNGENLFTAFFTQKEGGTGLGLTIAHRIITAHGGDIVYGNRSEGGARFTIQIPIDQDAFNPESV